MQPFPRRTYRSFGQLAMDVKYIMQRRHAIRPMMRGDLSPQFRERLMLAVTAVNECRYCAYFHLKMADSIGLSETEARSMLDRRVDHCPADEIPALLYAQHWAERDARPDPEARAGLIATYGVDQADRIEVVLRMIRLGNLAGNSVDAVLYCLSFGRLGHQPQKGLTS